MDSQTYGLALYLRGQKKICWKQRKATVHAHPINHFGHCVTTYSRRNRSTQRKKAAVLYNQTLRNCPLHLGEFVLYNILWVDLFKAIFASPRITSRESRSVGNDPIVFLDHPVGDLPGDPAPPAGTEGQPHPDFRALLSHTYTCVIIKPIAQIQTIVVQKMSRPLVNPRSRSPHTTKIPIEERVLTIVVCTVAILSNIEVL